MNPYPFSELNHLTVPVAIWATSANYDIRMGSGERIARRFTRGFRMLGSGSDIDESGLWGLKFRVEARFKMGVRGRHPCQNANSKMEPRIWYPLIGWVWSNWNLCRWYAHFVLASSAINWHSIATQVILKWESVCCDRISVLIMSVGAAKVS